MDKEFVSNLSDDAFGDLFVACCERVQKNGGRLPREAYFAKNQTFPTGFVEIVCVYVPVDGEPEILLEQRSADDPFWAGQWCTQGLTVMVRQTLSEVARAHARRECGIPICDDEIARLEFAGAANMPNLRREHALEQVFVRRFSSKPSDAKGTWFPVGHLPGNIIPHMFECILPIVFDYLATGRPSWREHLGAL